MCFRMAQFINRECGAEGNNSDDDFEDWLQPRNARARGTGRGRGGGRVATLRRVEGRGTLPEPEGGL